MVLSYSASVRRFSVTRNDCFLKTIGVHARESFQCQFCSSRTQVPATVLARTCGKRCLVWNPFPCFSTEPGRAGKSLCRDKTKREAPRGDLLSSPWVLLSLSVSHSIGAWSYAVRLCSSIDRPVFLSLADVALVTTLCCRLTCIIQLLGLLRCSLLE